MLSGVLVYDSHLTMGTPTTLAIYDTENVPSIFARFLFYSKGFIISHENTFEMIEISSVIVKSFIRNCEKL